MLQDLLQKLRDYWADTDDPRPGAASGGDPPSRDNERLERIQSRLLVELAREVQALRQRVAALEARLP